MPYYWIFTSLICETTILLGKNMLLFFYHKQVSIEKDKALKFTAYKEMYTTMTISYKPQSQVWQASLKLGVFHSNHHAKETGAFEEVHHPISVTFSIKKDCHAMKCIIQCQLPSLFAASLAQFKTVEENSWTCLLCFGDSGSVGDCGDLIQDQNFPHSIMTSVTPGSIKSQPQSTESLNPKKNKGKGINPFLFQTQGIQQLVRAHHHSFS